MNEIEILAGISFPKEFHEELAKILKAELTFGYLTPTHVAYIRSLVEEYQTLHNFAEKLLHLALANKKEILQDIYQSKTEEEKIRKIEEYTKILFPDLYKMILRNKTALFLAIKEARAIYGFEREAEISSKQVYEERTPREEIQEVKRQSLFHFNL